MSDTDYPGAPMGSLADQSAMMPETYVNPFVDQTIRHVAQIPQRAIETAAHYQQTGEYNPGPILDAAMLGMTGGIGATGEGGVALGSGPIRAYHSSPHDFEKFDLSKVGTGEGAQAYGHGIYAAESPKVSGQGGQYWNSFMHRFDRPEEEAAAQLKAAGFDRQMAIAASKKNIEELQSVLTQRLGPGVPYIDTPEYMAQIKNMLEQRQAQHEHLTSGNPVGPRTYEIGIHADPENLLHWDKPLTEQPQSVKDALGLRMTEQSGPSGYLMKSDRLGGWHNPDNTGGAFYQGLRSTSGDRRAASAVTDALREAGIPGVKYLDQGSRGAGIPKSLQHQYKPWGGELDVPKPTHNYVVFNPDLIEIMRKYGIAAAPAGAMGALAAQDKLSPSTEGG